MIDFNGQNIVNEKIILEKNEANIIGSNILSYDTYNKNLNDLQKSIRRIVINNESYGTGFLMKLEKENTPFYCLITNEHVIPEELIETKAEIKILYAQNNQKDVLKIKLDQGERFIRNYGYLGIDATAVQIFPEKDEIKKEFFFKNNNIELLSKDNYKILENKNIHILQYPGSGNVLSISQGDYLGIFNINEFYHSASTEPGSSGSPIFVFFDSTIIIFGIHKGGKENRNVGEFIYPLIHSLKINAYFEKSKIFKGEIIEEKDHCIQIGELLYLDIKKENEKKRGKEREKEKKKFKYIGMLKNYRPNGKGTLYKKCKENNKYIIKYCGDFVDGNFEGKGILYYNYKAKTYYEGEFKDNKRNGYGKYYFKNNKKYEGEFKDDEYDGEGTIYYDNGSYYKGGFANGKKNAEGAIYDKNNYILEEGEFEDDTTPVNGIINKIAKNQNSIELNNTLNEVLSCGRTILNVFGIETKFKCGNCGCSTDEHHLIGNSDWECHLCNKICRNNCIQGLFT